MPRGFARIKQKAEELEDFEKRPSRLYFKIDSGDTATVRFLEQGEDVFSYYVHQIGDYRTKVACLDQDDEGVSCPGCRHEFPRRLRGLINLIWREAPVFKKDDEGQVVKPLVIEGHEDQVAIWESGVETFNSLGSKDVAYKGLSSRDFNITRKGKDRKTKYEVEPAEIDGGPQPPSSADKKLAKDKYDLEEVAYFVDEDTFNEIIEKKLEQSEESEKEVEEVNQFLDGVKSFD